MTRPEIVKGWTNGLPLLTILTTGFFSTLHWQIFFQFEIRRLYNCFSLNHSMLDYPHMTNCQIPIQNKLPLLFQTLSKLFLRLSWMRLRVQSAFSELLFFLLLRGVLYSATRHLLSTFQSSHCYSSSWSALLTILADRQGQLIQGAVSWWVRLVSIFPIP